MKPLLEEEQDQSNRERGRGEGGGREMRKNGVVSVCGMKKLIITLFRTSTICFLRS